MSEKNDKNSKVSGWVKPQLGNVEMLFCVSFLCCFRVSKCFKWVMSDQSEFCSDLFTLTRPLISLMKSGRIVHHRRSCKPHGCLV